MGLKKTQANDNNPGREKLRQLIDKGSAYALMKAAVEHWLATDEPGLEWTTLVGRRGKGLPDVNIPFTSPSS